MTQDSRWLGFDDYIAREYDRYCMDHESEEAEEYLEDYRIWAEWSDWIDREVATTAMAFPWDGGNDDEVHAEGD